jgi:hypothetical protein
VYCIHYFVTKLNIEDAASTFLYFGYTLIMVFLFFLLTGKLLLVDYGIVPFSWKSMYLTYMPHISSIQRAVLPCFQSLEDEKVI